MTKKIFYQFVIKTVGLFTLKEFIEGILQSIALVFYDTPSNTALLISVFSILLALAIKVGLIYVCLIKTDKIIEILKLADGDEVLTDWYFDMNTLLSLAIIVIGLLMIVSSLPTLVLDLKDYIRNKDDFAIFNPRQNTMFIIPVSRLIIGFLLISNYKLLIKWINKTSELTVSDNKKED